MFINLGEKIKQKMKAKISFHTKATKLSPNRNVFLPDIVSKSTKSVSVGSPTMLSKNSSLFPSALNTEIFLSPSQSINVNQYFLSSRKDSLHTNPSPADELIKSIAMATNLQVPRHKSSKSHFVNARQLDFLKEAYKPRSHLAQAQLEDAIKKKQAQAQIRRRRETKSQTLINPRKKSDEKLMNTEEEPPPRKISSQTKSEGQNGDSDSRLKEEKEEKKSEKQEGTKHNRKKAKIKLTNVYTDFHKSESLPIKKSPDQTTKKSPVNFIKSRFHTETLFENGGASQAQELADRFRASDPQNQDQSSDPQNHDLSSDLQNRELSNRDPSSDYLNREDSIVDHTKRHPSVDSIPQNRPDPPNHPPIDPPKPETLPPNEYHIEIINRETSLNLDSLSKVTQPVISENLPNIPSHLSVIRPSNKPLPSIKVNNEAVRAKMEVPNGSHESSLIVEKSEEYFMTISNTPKSLQNIEEIGKQEKKKATAQESPLKSKGNGELVSEKPIESPKKPQLNAESKKLSDSAVKSPSIKSITTSSISSFKGKPIFTRKSNRSLTLKNQASKSISPPKSDVQISTLQKPSVIPLPDESLHHMNTPGPACFQADLSLNFDLKAKLYKKRERISKQSQRKSSQDSSKARRIKLPFFAFLEKIKRFFENYWKPEPGLTGRVSIDKGIGQFLKASKFYAGSAGRGSITNHPEIILPAQTLRTSLEKEKASNSLSPEWRRENCRIFSQSSRHLVNIRLSHSQTPRTSRKLLREIKSENESQTSETSERQPGKDREDYEEVLSRINQKMKEHNEILSNNYFHYTQNNVRTIMNEEYVIYLETLVASDYFRYLSLSVLTDPIKGQTRKEPLRVESRRTLTFSENIPIFRMNSKQTLSVQPVTFTVKEDEMTAFEYLSQSEFKNLKMVIDEEVDDSLVDEGHLFEKLAAEGSNRKRNSLIVDSPGLYRARIKSKYLSVGTPTSMNSQMDCEFFLEEDEFLYENSEVAGKRINARLTLDVFLDISKRQRFFERDLEESVVPIISKLDYQTLAVSLLKSENKIDPAIITRIEAESEQIFRKERLLHEMGQTYLRHNKPNFLAFCEEHRNILFGFFEDFYYESVQLADYSDGEKRKKVNMLVQGLPLGSVGKQYSVKSLTSNAENEENPLSVTSDGLKGAFLASRKKLFIKNPNSSNHDLNVENPSTNKSRNDNGSMLLELGFEEFKETSLNMNRPVKKEDSTISTQTQTQSEAKYIKDDLFFRNSETSFRLIKTRRNTNSEFKLGFKGSSPQDGRKAMIGLPGKIIRENSTKRILPQIPENELKLPSDRASKGKKPEDRMHASQEKPQPSPPGSPDRRSAHPKIFIEIPRPGNRLPGEKETHSGRLRSNTVTNHGGILANVPSGDEIDERVQDQETDTVLKDCLIEKNNEVTMTKNSMVLTNYLLHFNRKRNMNVLEQFFFAIKDEKMNELEELFFMYPNIFIDARDDENNTMLINAARVGNLGMVNLILSKGPNMNLRNVWIFKGNTALHYSLAYGYDDVTNKLLRSGAQETIKNNEGRRPWDMLMRE